MMLVEQHTTPLAKADEPAIADEAEEAAVDLFRPSSSEFRQYLRVDINPE
ncbi:MAG: hypothetical protein ACXAD7_16020 [Candidatus Kariarchaeaceae archaeon]